MEIFSQFSQAEKYDKLKRLIKVAEQGKHEKLQPRGQMVARGATGPPRNIVICSDGTSNEFGRKNTNVATLHWLLQKDPERQLTFYDPGVGTLGDRGEITWLQRQFTKTLGLAFARGITRNIEDAYIFLMNNFEPGDRIFMFGFSRGAFTVRALAGMISRVGLLPKGADNLVPYASKMSRDKDQKLAEIFKEGLSRDIKCNPYFVGVWDTVKSVGFFKPRKFPNLVLNESVQHGRHALALDEKRGMFQPTLWEPASEGQCIRQLWFVGGHCNVGGGLDSTELSDIAMIWMAQEAESEGLILKPNWEQHAVAPNAHAPIFSGVFPRWWWFPFHRRHLPKDAELHHSVEERGEKDPAYGKKIKKPVSLFDRFLGAVPCLLLLILIGSLAGAAVNLVAGQGAFTDHPWQYVLVGILVALVFGFSTALTRWYFGGD